MSNILTIDERFKLFLQQPDGVYIKKYLQLDFSTIEQFHEDLIKTVLAFGNTEGGHIIIKKLDLLNTFSSNSLYDKIKISCVNSNTFFNIEEVEYNSNNFFYIQINKSTTPIKHKNGKYYKRNKAVNQEWKLDFEPNINKENEIKSIEYEREIVSNATYDDLDEVLITEIINNSKSIQIKEPKKFLQQYNLIEPKGNDDFLITRAALLLFSKKPKKWHPNIDIRFTQFKASELPTGENFSRVKDETEEGNILTLIKTSWEKIRPLLTETNYFSKDKQFKTQILYPEDACAEALLNAIAHRDYSIQGRCIEIRIFEDKLEVISPGGLLSTINIQDLIDCKGVHESRNPIIARTLREIGYMRELGEGIKRIYDTLRENDLQNPLLENTESSFKVTLFHKYIYTTDEKKYLLNFSDIELPKIEKDIIRLGVLNKPLSRSDIMNAANLKSADDFQKVITPLIKKGFIKILYNQVDSRNRANKLRIEVKDLPRFLVLLPGQEAKYDTVKNENILKRNPTCIIVRFIPLTINLNEIEKKLSDLNIDYEILKTNKYEDAHSVSFDLKTSENVRKVLENKGNIIALNENIKVFPGFKDEYDKERINSTVEKETFKKKYVPTNQDNTNSKPVYNKSSYGYKLPFDYKIPVDYTNCSIKVKNIPTNVGEEEIIKFFQQFGKVIDLTVDKNVKNQIYLKFEEPRAAHFLISKSGAWWFKGNTLMIVAKSEKLTPGN
jgi:ATP-dependent DNA helicase RecG